MLSAEKKTVPKTAEKRPAPNSTGIPTAMKRRFETASGFSLDDVRIHYHSERPGRIGALAYTQGTQVHIAPGQERHLPHELGHVVQQKQGLVRPTARLGGMPANLDPALERSASGIGSLAPSTPMPRAVSAPAVVQCALSAAVSLRHKGLDPDAPISPDEMIVETIKLDGRSPTNLLSPDENATQGDHTIADALMKKYQKVMVREMPVPAAAHFYQNLLNEVKLDNEPVETADYRAHVSVSIAKQGLEKLQNLSGPMPERHMRKMLISVIRDFNDAYASSVTATQGVGTGGHGEAMGMDELRRLHSQNQTVSAGLYSLIDMESLYSAASSLESDFAAPIEGTVNSVIARFVSILSEMRGYKVAGWQEARQQNALFQGETDMSALRIAEANSSELTVDAVKQQWSAVFIERNAQQVIGLHKLFQLYLAKWELLKQAPPPDIHLFIQTACNYLIQKADRIICKTPSLLQDSCKEPTAKALHIVELIHTFTQEALSLQGKQCLQAFDEIMNQLAADLQVDVTEISKLITEYSGQTAPDLMSQHFTPSESQIMGVLHTNFDQPCTYDVLIEAIQDTAKKPSHETVVRLIGNIRKKLPPQHTIITLPRIGYQLTNHTDES